MKFEKRKVDSFLTIFGIGLVALDLCFFVMLNSGGVSLSTKVLSLPVVMAFVGLGALGLGSYGLLKTSILNKQNKKEQKEDTSSISSEERVSLRSYEIEIQQENSKFKTLADSSNQPIKIHLPKDSHLEIVSAELLDAKQLILQSKDNKNFIVNLSKETPGENSKIKY